MSIFLQRFALLICLLLAAAALYTHLGDDLWNDEIYTLQFFVFKGIGTIVGDYHVPNNHIFANVLHWLWLNATGARDLGVLLDHPWRIRLLPLGLSALTVWWVYHAGRQVAGTPAGWLAAARASR